MNTYTYDEIKIGMAERFTVTVNDDMMAAFRAITGDDNPLHCDTAYATGKGYDGRVVYGMLVSSFYSTLAGMYLPGKNSLLHSVESKMVKPVYVGDTLTVQGEVTEKMDTFRFIIVKARIVNQRNEAVSRAKIQVGVLP